MRGIGLRECNKAGTNFLYCATELMLDIHLHVFRPPPLIASIPFREWSRYTCHKYSVFSSENCSRISESLGFTPKYGRRVIYNQG